MGRVQDKVILMTGGAMGVGHARCELLASEGARLCVADMSADLGEAVAAGVPNFWRSTSPTGRSGVRSSSKSSSALAASMCWSTTPASF
jgi:NAD(P)-dependent dehydrogenase (short-subunit alcohol dehydrogenase family)